MSDTQATDVETPVDATEPSTTTESTTEPTEPTEDAADTSVSTGQGDAVDDDSDEAAGPDQVES